MLVAKGRPLVDQDKCRWIRERTFSSLWFGMGTSARKATVPATSEVKFPVFTHKKGTHLTCCMVLPGCHIVMDNCVLLLIWLITESQTITFKVTRNGQASPVCLWQSLLTVCWRGNQFAAALVKTFQALVCHASLYLLMVVWSYVIVYSFHRTNSMWGIPANCMGFLSNGGGEGLGVLMGIERTRSFLFSLHGSRRSLGFLFLACCML